MANALGTLAPSLVAQRTLDYLKEIFPPALRMFIGFSDAPVLLGQTITTRIPGSSAAYDASGGYSAPDLTDADRPVVASNFKATSIAFTAAELSSTNRDLVNEHAAGAANELASDLIAQLCALFINANYPTASQATEEDPADYDDDTLRAVRKKLNLRKATQLGRFGIVNSDVFEALSGDALVTSIDSNSDAHDDYKLAPMVLRGFDIIEFPTLPANAIDLNGVFMSAGGVIGATGVPADSNAAGMFDEVPNVARVETVVDEATGLALLQRLHKTASGGIQMDLAWVFGFAKGNTPNVELMRDVQA